MNKVTRCMCWVHCSYDRIGSNWPNVVPKLSALTSIQHASIVLNICHRRRVANIWDIMVRLGPDPKVRKTGERAF